MKPLLLLGLAMAFGVEARAASLDFTVRPTWAGEPLQLDSLRYQSAAGETVSLTRLSYLLADFALEREDGTWVELPPQQLWLDASKRRDRGRLEGVPDGPYRALRFHVGLDPATNATDPARFPATHPLNAQLNGLHWGWQGGYVFLALEGRFQSGPELSGYALHLARDRSRTKVELAAPLDLRHDAAVLLEFDLAALLNSPRPISLAKDGRSTHSRDDDPLAAALAANLPSAFSIRQVGSAVPEISRRSAVRPLYLPGKFTPYRFAMSALFPIPALPRDNPLIEERIRLGEALFQETRLSRDGSLSCASCHVSAFGFADPRRVSLGVALQPGSRNAMPLANLAWKTSFFWDGRAKSLREQVLIPIQEHREMDASLEQITAKLGAEPRYAALFSEAFDEPAITPEKIALALEQYLLTLTAYRSKFDRAQAGQATLSAEEQRGLELFMTEYEPRTGQRGADCFHCHGGALFTDDAFHSNGLEGDDSGRFAVTHAESDRGKFSTPSLRNVALTAPYMHDGRFATLEQVVAHYDHGVARTPNLDPNLAKHPPEGLQLSEPDQHALVAFLRTLSDE